MSSMPASQSTETTNNNDSSRREGQQVKKLPLKRRQREQLDLIRSFFFHQTVVVEGGSLTAEARYLPTAQDHQLRSSDKEGNLENLDKTRVLIGPSFVEPTFKTKQPQQNETTVATASGTSTTTTAASAAATTTKSPWQVLTQSTSDTYSSYNQDQSHQNHQLPQKYYQKLLDDSRKTIRQQVQRMADYEELPQPHVQQQSQQKPHHHQQPQRSRPQVAPVVAPPPPPNDNLPLGPQHLLQQPVPTKFTNYPIKRSKKDIVSNKSGRPTSQTNKNDKRQQIPLTQQQAGASGHSEKRSSPSILPTEAQRLLLKQHTAVAESQTASVAGSTAVQTMASATRKDPQLLKVPTIISPMGQPYNDATMTEVVKVVNKSHHDNKDNKNSRKSDKPVAPLATKLPASRTAAKDAPRHVVESIIGRLLTESTSQIPATHQNQSQQQAGNISSAKSSTKTKAPPPSKKSRFKKAAIPKAKGTRPRGRPRTRSLYSNTSRTDDYNVKRSTTPPPPPLPVFDFANVLKKREPTTTPYGNPHVQYEPVNPFYADAAKRIQRLKAATASNIRPATTQMEPNEPNTTSDCVASTAEPSPRLQPKVDLTVAENHIPSPTVPDPHATAEAKAIAEAVFAKTTPVANVQNNVLLQNVAVAFVTKDFAETSDAPTKSIKGTTTVTELDVKARQESAASDSASTVLLPSSARVGTKGGNITTPTIEHPNQALPLPEQNAHSKATLQLSIASSTTTTSKPSSSPTFSRFKHISKPRHNDQSNKRSSSPADIVSPAKRRIVMTTDASDHQSLNASTAKDSTVDVATLESGGAGRATDGVSSVLLSPALATSPKNEFKEQADVEHIALQQTKDAHSVDAKDVGTDGTDDTLERATVQINSTTTSSLLGTAESFHRSEMELKVQTGSNPTTEPQQAAVLEKPASADSSIVQPLQNSKVPERPATTAKNLEAWREDRSDTNASAVIQQLETKSIRDTGGVNLVSHTRVEQAINTLADEESSKQQKFTASESRLGGVSDRENTKGSSTDKSSEVTDPRSTTAMDQPDSKADTFKDVTQPGSYGTHGQSNYSRHFGKSPGTSPDEHDEATDSLVDMLPPEPQKTLLYLKRQLAVLQRTVVTTLPTQIFRAPAREPPDIPQQALEPSTCSEKEPRHAVPIAQEPLETEVQAQSNPVHLATTSNDNQNDRDALVDAKVTVDKIQEIDDGNTAEMTSRKHVEQESNNSRDDQRSELKSTSPANMLSQPINDVEGGLPLSADPGATLKAFETAQDNSHVVKSTNGDPVLPEATLPQQLIKSSSSGSFGASGVSDRNSGQDGYLSKGESETAARANENRPSTPGPDPNPSNATSVWPTQGDEKNAASLVTNPELVTDVSLAKTEDELSNCLQSRETVVAGISELTYDTNDAKIQATENVSDSLPQKKKNECSNDVSESLPSSQHAPETKESMETRDMLAPNLGNAGAQEAPAPDLTTTAKSATHFPPPATVAAWSTSNNVTGSVSAVNTKDLSPERELSEGLAEAGEADMADDSVDTGLSQRSAPRFKKLPRSNRGKATTDVPPKPLVTADSVPSSDLSVASPVPSQSTSHRRTLTMGAQYCHSCKKKSFEYRGCTYWVWSKCGKRFCRACLENEYGQTEDWNSLLNEKDWHCPACLKTCKCGPCVKLRSRESLEPLRKSRREKAHV